MLAATNASLLRKGIENLDHINDVEENCLEEALEVAVLSNNHESAGILIMHGANNASELFSTVFQKPTVNETAVLLLLCHAAKIDDKEFFQLILKEQQATDPKKPDNTVSILKRDYLPDEWSNAVTEERLLNLGKLASCIDKKVPIRAALKEGCYETAKIIIFDTYCNREESEADWKEIGLTSIQDHWLDELKGYKRLVLAANGLNQLPMSITRMTELVRLDLSRNSLSQIPKELFGLPYLRNLNLSYNKMKSLPIVKAWSKTLKFLYLTANKLDCVPESIDQSALEELDISHNNLTLVQECICNIKRLSYLNISNNDCITSLPPELAKLKRLNYLGIKNMDQITDPPPALRKTTAGLLRHLRAKLRSSEAYYAMKLMIVGLVNRGKTTLLHRLYGDFDFDQNLSTKGIDIKELTITKDNSFVFKCWDFAGQEEYYATHQCFLSQRSLYLLIWKVTDVEEGIASMKQWLDNLETRVPYSTVIVVGTHLDQVSDDDIEHGFEATMNQKVHDLVSSYSKINNPDNAILMVTCNSLNPQCGRTIENLREVIYSVAENMTVTGKKNDRKIMGEMIPSSYLFLAKTIENHRLKLQESNKIPILVKHEFEALVLENAESAPRDAFDPDDIQNASVFLNDIGIIIHYDDPNQHLNDLYFVDPSWLCDLMAKVVTVKEAQSFIRDGILYENDIAFIFGKEDARFTTVFYPQYMRLLYRFHIGWRIDEGRILIPSQLPINFPVEEAKSLEPSNVLVRLHSFSRVPRGFWSRFIGRFLLYVKDMLTIYPGRSYQRERRYSLRAADPYYDRFDDSPDVSCLLRNGFLKCWRKGILLSHPKLFLSVRAIPDDRSRSLIETRVSRNLLGYRALCFIVDHIRTLVKEWYPGLSGSNGSEPCIRQLAMCPICKDTGVEPPFMFDVNDCLKSSAKQEYVICSKEHNPQSISLKEVCPDIMFMDLPLHLRLNSLQLKFDEVKECLLGKGGFGEVYRGMYENTPAAIKINTAIADDESTTEIEEKFYNMRQEVIMLSKVDHPNIIQFLGVSVRPKLCSVIEFARKGSLKKLIKGKMGPIERILIYRIAKQVACALSYLHHRGIVHRDLKPDNILMFSKDLASDINVKVSDFGTADFMSCTGLKHAVGSIRFEAPELSGGLDEYTFKVDVYSFAMVLYEIITQRRPFHWLTEDAFLQIHRLVHQGKRPPFEDIISAKFGFLTLTELMLKTWEQEAIRRPTSSDVLKQLMSPSFCLLYGKLPLAQTLHSRQLCLVPVKYELWVVLADYSYAEIVVVDLKELKIVKKFKPKMKQNQEECDYCFLKGVHMLDQNHVVMIFKGISSDHIVLYSSEDKSFLASYQFIGDAITAFTATKHSVFLGLQNGAFVQIAKNDFLNGEFRGTSNSVDAMSDIFALAVFESNLFVGSDKLVYKFKLSADNQNNDVLPDGITSNNHQVKTLVLSSDGLVLFVSFKDSPVISCWLVDTLDSLGYIDCSDVLSIIYPQTSVYGRQVSCFCVNSDTLWVGTGGGHILIYEINTTSSPSFITWLQPYKGEVLSMACCSSAVTGLPDSVITVGKELNSKGLSQNTDGVCQLTSSFPVDEWSAEELQSNVEQQNNSFLLLWEGAGANNIRKICHRDR